jgi:beta-lactamase superfamily II metal-dependent hydrolase
MFRIRMLPADYGDCLWVEYGSARTTYRILIDAGTLPAYKAVRAAIEKELKEEERRFHLFLVSHIDLDHIDAAVRLLHSPSLNLRFDQIWFNGWTQLLGKDVLGPQQGEYLSGLIGERKIPLNRSFRGAAIFAPSSGRLRRIKLPGGMVLTVLAPGPAELNALRTQWKKTMGKQAGNAKAALRKLAAAPRYRDVLGAPHRLDVRTLAESVTTNDKSVPNGSSIVVLAEYDGKRCLFAADSRPDILESAVDRLLRASKQHRLLLDAFKVPHHGSKHNNSMALLQKLNCRKFLISTNGRKFDHPHPEAIARIIRYGGPRAELYFNYDTSQTRPWNDPALKRKFRYSVTIRPDSAPSLDIEL